MSGLFLENPWLVGCLGFALSALTLFAWIKTGQTVAWKAAAAMFGLTVLLVAINVWVDTEREVVTRTLYQLAADLEGNRFQQVIARIHPDASPELLQLKTQLQDVHFDTARIKAIHGIQFGSSKTPRTAAVRMNVVVGGERSGMKGTVPRWVRLQLEQDRGQWMVVNYEFRDPHYEMLNQNARDRLDSYRHQ
jgi:hypothetical protein